MPLDYPPELICTASCNNPDCCNRIGVECQHGDLERDVQIKLKRKGWIVDGDAVFCSEACRFRHAGTTRPAAAPVRPRTGGLTL
jgi:hypothetical protein